MSHKENKHPNNEEIINEQESALNNEPELTDNEGDSEVVLLKQEIGELKDKYLRKAAEFENYQRRTAKEKNELKQTAGKEIIVDLLDIIDDIDRASAQIDKSEDLNQIKEGVHLIFNKFKNFLKNKGITEMESKGEEFNPDLHEAITEIPAPTEDLAGKVVDQVQKGYYQNGNLIRHAKVVVGK